MKNFKYALHAAVLVMVTTAGYLVFTHRSATSLTSADDILSGITNGKNLAEAQSFLTPSAGVADGLKNRNKPPEGYIQYKNDKYKFSFYHSPESKITEYKEAGGAATIVLENLKKIRGFQIFIVPYNGTVITPERFKKDVPSGVIKDKEETQIGDSGVKAITFHSYDKILGATREVWFIKDGYLFEITTIQGLGDWFVPIMQTWSFIK